MKASEWARRALIVLLCALVYFAWRAAYTRLFLERAFYYSGQILDAELVVESFSEPSAYGYAASVRFQGVKTTFYYDGQVLLEPGDTVTGKIRVDRTDYFGGAHLKAVLQGGAMEVSKPESAPLRYLPAWWSKSVREKIGSILPDEPGALLKGILTGDRSAFSAALTSDLSATGLSHVAAVSGLHVSMLLGFIVLITGSGKRAAIIGIPLIWAFVALTGFSASAMRAGIMISMTLIAPRIGREYTPLAALGTAFFILLLINPYSIQEPGFQLSFLATLGIILFSEKLRGLTLKAMPKKSPAMISRTLSSTLAASLSALALSTPVAAYWFGSVSLIAPLTNLLLLWLVNLIFISGAVSVLAAYIWWPMGYIIAFIPRALLMFFRWCVGVFAKIPYARLQMTRPILLAWLLFVYIMVMLMALGLRKRKGLALVTATLVICVALDYLHASMFSLEVAVLNVGQGQCVVMRSGGKTAVVDCGGNLGDAGNVAADYLESVGVRSLDALIFTHLHADHANGADTLLERMNVKDIYLSAYEEGEKPEFAYNKLYEETWLELGNARLLLVPAMWEGGDNERSMSVLCIMDDFSFITTGDLGASSERWLTRWLSLPDGGLMLAGHHGSAGSSSQEYVGALSPQAAVISVGRNTYGHPTQEALSVFESLGCSVYRTDVHGHVIIKVP